MDRQTLIQKIIAKETVEKLADSIIQNGLALVHLDQNGEMQVACPSEQFEFVDDKDVH